RNAFLDPVGASCKLDRNARETVSWRGRSDPPTETFFFDDQRDWFAYRPGFSRTCPYFLCCQHCFALHSIGAREYWNRYRKISIPVPSLPKTRQLPHGGEGRWNQQLVVLPNPPYAGLGRPRATGRAGGLTDPCAFGEIMVHPDVHELVQPTELARPARRQR